MGDIFVRFPSRLRSVDFDNDDDNEDETMQVVDIMETESPARRGIR